MTDTLFDYIQDQLKSASTDALRNTACIATFSSSRFGDDIKDDELASELGSAHGTSSANFNVTKKLFAGCCPELDALEQHVRATYTKHRKLTQPWKKRGGGLLPNAKITEYLGMMGEASQRLAALRDACRQALPQAHARAAIKLGSAYRESDYRDLLSIPDRFEIHYEIEPIPDGSDLVLPQGYETLQMRGLYEGVRARFARAINVQWQGLQQAIAEARAKSADGVDVKRWHGSTVDNIKTRAHDLRSFVREIGCFDDTSPLVMALGVIIDGIETHSIKRIASMESERKRFHRDCVIWQDKAVESPASIKPTLEEILDEFEQDPPLQDAADAIEIDEALESAEQEVLAREQDREDYEHPVSSADEPEPVLPEWMTRLAAQSASQLTALDGALGRLMGDSSPRTPTVPEPVGSTATPCLRDSSSVTPDPATPVAPVVQDVPQEQPERSVTSLEPHPVEKLGASTDAVSVDDIIKALLS